MSSLEYGWRIDIAPALTQPIAHLASAFFNVVLDFLFKPSKSINQRNPAQVPILRRLAAARRMSALRATGLTPLGGAAFLPSEP